LGKPTKVGWSEIWHVLKPLIDKPFRGGPATWMEDILLKVNRNNFDEETHFTIAYSPVPDSKAERQIGGVLATVNEITGEIIGKRQMETLGRLGKAVSTTLSLDGSTMFSSRLRMFFATTHSTFLLHSYTRFQTTERRRPF
jgi:hypothetical protein